MNKTKIVLAGIGGVIGLVVLALAVFVWLAFAGKSAAFEGDEEEGTDGLETVEARARDLSRKPVYPSEKSLKAIAENQQAVDDWCQESLTLAARGDKVFEKTTSAAFKDFLVADAHRIAGLPGGVAGRLVKPDFAFGPFKSYIAEGKMPAESELANLQRQWDDVAMIAETLSTNGVTELLDVSFAAAKGDQGSGIRDQVSGRRDQGSGIRDQGKKGNKRKGSGKSNGRTIEESIVSHSYVFTFAAKPAAFIATLNQLEACERFITVDSFTFTRPVDAVVEALGGDEKKAAEAQAAGGRRGRRGRRGSGEAESLPLQQGGQKSAAKNGIVTDPALDAPLTVTMTVSVHDFRSLEENGEAESLPLEKGASK